MCVYLCKYECVCMCAGFRSWYVCVCIRVCAFVCVCVCVLLLLRSKFGVACEHIFGFSHTLPIWYSRLNPDLGEKVCRCVFSMCLWNRRLSLCHPGTFKSVHVPKFMRIQTGPPFDDSSEGRGATLGSCTQFYNYVGTPAKDRTRDRRCRRRLSTQTNALHPLRLLVIVFVRMELHVGLIY